MKYHDITKVDMKNGDGLRVVLWVSGCSHHCVDCQNPITWDPNDGIEFNESTKEEIYKELDKDYISGITLSGGDPLYYDNIPEIEEFIKEISQRYSDKTIWLYTGYVYEDIKDLNLLKYIDILVDGEFIVEKKDNLAKWKGSTNQRVIDVQESLRTNTIVLHCD